MDFKAHSPAPTIDNPHNKMQSDFTHITEVMGNMHSIKNGVYGWRGFRSDKFAFQQHVAITFLCNMQCTVSPQDKVGGFNRAGGMHSYTHRRR